MTRFHQGFSLAEVVFAIGLVAVAVLALVGLGTASLKSIQKSGDTEQAHLLAQDRLEVLSDKVTTDEPPGFQQEVFDYSSSTPFEEGFEKIGGTEFQWALFLEPVALDIEPNRLVVARCQVVWWEGERGRTGYGQFVVNAERLLNEPKAP